MFAPTRRLALVLVILLASAGCSNGSSHRSASPSSSARETTPTTARPGPALSIVSARNGRWSDSTTWSPRTVPTARDHVEIRHAVTCAGPSDAAGVTVNAAAALTFDPNHGCVLSTSRNVIVNGTLVMKPASASITDTLRFVHVDETRFVDQGTVPLPTDVGLWIVGSGQLVAIGAPKNGWTNSHGAIAKGATSIAVQDASGWRPGDHLFISPTQPPTGTVSTASFRGFDEGTITAVSHGAITIDHPTRYPHPQVDGRFTPEVGNLSRNVHIEGTPQGYSHVFVHSSKPQTIRYVEERFMGVQPGHAPADATGRYALHFHHDGDSSRGSIVEGVAVHDTHNHVFVPHASNGVTFRDDLAYNVHGAAVWWDPKNKYNLIPTNDTNIDRMLVARVRPVLGSRGPREHAFRMGFGAGNRLTNSVAVGLDAANESAGFFWADNEGSDGEWFFQNNTAHNNHEQGIFVWQNTSQPHVIDHFSAYYNTGKGIDHGAYANLYTYTNLTLYGNAEAGLLLRAVNSHTAVHPERRLSFTNVVIDGAGISPYDVLIGGHNTGGTKRPTPLIAFTMTGYTHAAVHVEATTLIKPDWVDFVDPVFADNDKFYVDAGTNPMNVVRVLAGAVVQYQVRPVDFMGGSIVAAWNARMAAANTPISGAGTPRATCGKRKQQKHSKACPNN
ncbi:MAG: hypothetical protein JWL83_4242 [Actinomycetia bacterium]|nr:hypothetical protein [Actinomycetes bacterium]